MCVVTFYVYDRYTVRNPAMDMLHYRTFQYSCRWGRTKFETTIRCEIANRVENMFKNEISHCVPKRGFGVKEKLMGFTRHPIFYWSCPCTVTTKLIMINVSMVSSTYFESLKEIWLLVFHWTGSQKMSMLTVNSVLDDTSFYALFENGMAESTKETRKQVHIHFTSIHDNNDKTATWVIIGKRLGLRSIFLKEPECHRKRCRERITCNLYHQASIKIVIYTSKKTILGALISSS